MDIKGFEGLYQISNLGRVRSVDRVVFQRHYSGCMSRYIYRGKIIKPCNLGNGYLSARLNKQGKPHWILVHRLVGMHFLEKPEGCDYINHKDFNRSNNRADNLEWCTQSENIQYSYDHGTKIPPHMRNISQYDSNGRLIKIWRSQSDAERGTGIKQANISKVCLGKRSHAGGFKWQYTE